MQQQLYGPMQTACVMHRCDAPAVQLLTVSRMQMLKPLPLLELMANILAQPA